MNGWQQAGFPFAPLSSSFLSVSKGGESKMQLHGDNVAGHRSAATFLVLGRLCGKRLMLLHHSSSYFFSCFQRQQSKISIHSRKRHRSISCFSMLGRSRFQCFGNDKVIIAHQRFIYFKNSSLNKEEGQRKEGN